jgi:hypothetical protein
MSALAHAVAHVDEIAPVVFDDPEDPDWTPIRHHFGIRSFGVNAWTARNAGDHVIERHTELPSDGGADSHEELYVVLGGRARFTVDDVSFAAREGTLVHVPDAASTREAIAHEPDTVVLAIGAAPGVAFAPAPWERRLLERVGRG